MEARKQREGEGRKASEGQEEGGKNRQTQTGRVQGQDTPKNPAPVIYFSHLGLIP
jgi:hypothetical protein